MENRRRTPVDGGTLPDERTIELPMLGNTVRQKRCDEESVIAISSFHIEFS